MTPFHDYYGIEWYLILLAWSAIALGSHFYQVGFVVRLIRLGKDDDRFNSWKQRLTEFLRDWLGQRKVVEDKVAGYAHALIFWGFLLLVSDVVDLGTGGLLQEFLSKIQLDGIWNLSVDLGYAMATIGILIALYRRIIIRPAKLKGASIEGPLILLAILGIILTAFIVEAGNMIGEETKYNPWEPIGVLFAKQMEGMDHDTIARMVDVSYWLHMILIGGFLIEIPQTKHSHLIGTIPNVMFQDHDPMGAMIPMQTDENNEAVKTDDLDFDNLTLGVNKFTDFTWRQLSDGWACTACARCQDVCPAYNSGKTLNPMQIVMDVKDYGREHGSLLLTGKEPEETMVDRFTPDAIWACTTCYACVEACPVHIEHVPKLTDTRRHLVMEASDFPEELQNLFNNLERNSNPWGLGAHTRADWAEGLDLKVGEPAEYLFFVGCAGSFDDRNKKVSRATAKLLKEAGVDFSILGEMETCNGDPARRAGNEFLFQMMAEMNVDNLNSLGTLKVITACPHCFHTIGKEYEKYGGKYEVYHHSQVLNKLRQEEKLKIRDFEDKVTFHDPCYLGRIGGETEAPRGALGGDLIEMERHGTNSFCCGGGGARVWMEEDADKRVNEIRAKEASKTGADCVAVGCPFCMTMMSDGLKSIGDDKQVKDISEIMLENLEAKT
uniref:Putative Fe-S oxidoreductase n=1 Tax=uncultured marine group II/III euryarchaeote AD1000_28_C09 TaxID=1457746 RepID=A0A075FTI8_9EURY|nr:putative Fe-S oxidoreductase [uncultured marine group II/III euryarchaeote AD1000_28_C09]